ncbi:MAG: hypothetical protein R3224_10945 [Balneolaceae bacterium]|nr:hypothetical protein [Balneolaceae bacterium]
MDDPSIFYLGIFVMVLFFAGILYTIREFKMMEDSKRQREYRDDSLKIDKER